jgi:hypothetical protein
MAWLKKNLVLVASGSVVLVLLGLAGYFLWTQISKELEVTASLGEQSTKLDGLLALDPQPTPQNITAAQDQEKEMERFLADVKKAFVPLAYDTNLDSGQFKVLLDTTVDQLRREAERAGVKLNRDYAFTFSSQKSLMSFDQNQIKPLSMALVEIRDLTRIFINARVLSLDGIRRVAFANDSPSLMSGQSDTWTRKITTNDLAYIVPYEFVFHGFTPELAAVLQGLAKSPHSFVVKNVAVDTSPSALLDTNAANPDGTSPSPVMAPTFPGGMNAAMAARYGLRGRGRYGQPSAAVAPESAVPTGPALPKRGGMEVLLEEKPFRAVLWIDVIRLRDPEEAKSSTKASARPARAPAAAAGAGADPAATPASPAPAASESE